MEIGLIKTPQERDEALREIERLWNAEPASASERRLELLGFLVARYEEETIPLKKGDPVDCLEWAISDGGRSQKQLAEILGSASRASEILSRKRVLNLDQIRKISAAWHIPIELLSRPYDVKASHQLPARIAVNDLVTRKAGLKKITAGVSGSWRPSQRTAATKRSAKKKV